jgi:hypothetical protein
MQPVEWRKHNEAIVNNLSKLIKRNKRLQHINLDQTQLTEYMLFHICKSLTRATSLLAIHCSGNPGITPNLREYLWRRIRCKDPNLKVHNLEVEKVDKSVNTWDGMQKLD